MEEKKRNRRTKEELAADIGQKIEALQEALAGLDDKREEAMQVFDEKEKKLRDRIKTLQEKKEAVLSPAPKRRKRPSKKKKLADLLKKINKSGLTPEEIAELLGVQSDSCPPGAENALDESPEESFDEEE